MRVEIVILFHLIFTTMTIWADEMLPTLKVGSDVYSNVTVIAVTPTDVFFTSESGIASAKLKNLAPALQKYFKYDAAKADATDKKEKAAATQNSLPVTTNAEQTIDGSNAKAIMDDAINRVKAIVNQPARRFLRTPAMKVPTYSPGWFHPGAIKPDFNTVDVRATQESDYSHYHYVTSDLNPGVVFIGSDLEFNSMTKYFYVDRTLPKKKLTQAQMLEINRLYRIIGKCEKGLNSP
jgi:hypothetical protein